MGSSSRSKGGLCLINTRKRLPFCTLLESALTGYRCRCGVLSLLVPLMLQERRNSLGPNPPIWVLVVIKQEGITDSQPCCRYARVSARFSYLSYSGPLRRDLHTRHGEALTEYFVSRLRPKPTLSSLKCSQVTYRIEPVEDL